MVIMPNFFLNSGAHPAAYNMACDEHLLNLVKNDPEQCFFRVYQWAPPAFTIGYSQRIREELDIEAARSAGYDMVRRPTGGRTVLHKNEMAYTFVSRAGGFKGKQDLSLTVGQLFVNTLRNLGVKAELVRTGARRPSPGTRPHCVLPTCRSAKLWWPAER